MKKTIFIAIVMLCLIMSGGRAEEKKKTVTFSHTVSSSKVFKEVDWTKLYGSIVINGIDIISNPVVALYEDGLDSFDSTDEYQREYPYGVSHYIDTVKRIAPEIFKDGGGTAKEIKGSQVIFTVAEKDYLRLKKLLTKLDNPVFYNPEKPDLEFGFSFHNSSNLKILQDMEWFVRNKGFSDLGFGVIDIPVDTHKRSIRAFIPGQWSADNSWIICFMGLTLLSGDSKKQKQVHDYLDKSRKDLLKRIDSNPLYARISFDFPGGTFDEFRVVLSNALQEATAKNSALKKYKINITSAIAPKRLLPSIKATNCRLFLFLNEINRDTGSGLLGGYFGASSFILKNTRRKRIENDLWEADYILAPTYCEDNPGYYAKNYRFYAFSGDKAGEEAKALVQFIWESCQVYSYFINMRYTPDKKGIFLRSDDMGDMIRRIDSWYCYKTGTSPEQFYKIDEVKAKINNLNKSPRTPELPFTSSEEKQARIELIKKLALALDKWLKKSD